MVVKPDAWWEPYSWWAAHIHAGLRLASQLASIGGRPGARPPDQPWPALPEGERMAWTHHPRWGGVLMAHPDEAAALTALGERTLFTVGSPGDGGLSQRALGELGERLELKPPPR